MIERRGSLTAITSMRKSPLQHESQSDSYLQGGGSFSLSKELLLLQEGVDLVTDFSVLWKSTYTVVREDLVPLGA